jgi:hypothetical protein
VRVGVATMQTDNYPPTNWAPSYDSDAYTAMFAGVEKRVCACESGWLPCVDGTMVVCKDCEVLDDSSH